MKIDFVPKSLFLPAKIDFTLDFKSKKIKEMATAKKIPKEELGKTRDGIIFHKETKLVFRDKNDYTVIGMLSEDKKSILPLDEAAVALCEENDFVHDPIVEEDKAEEEPAAEEPEEEPAAEEEEPAEEPEEEPVVEKIETKKQPSKAPAKTQTKVSAKTAVQERTIQLDADTELRKAFVQELDSTRATILCLLDNHSVFREVERAQQLDKEILELQKKMTEMTEKNEKLTKKVAALTKAIAEMQ